MKKLLTFIGHVIILTFLWFLAKEAWHGYKNEKLSVQAQKEGTPLKMRLDRVTQEKKIWKDYIGNSRYVTFNYEGKEYTMRYIQDTIFLMEGARVPVLYIPSADVFVQPGLNYHRREIIKTSPLVRWSVLALFSGPHVWLAAAIGLTGLFILLLTNALGTWTGITVLQKLGSLVIFICAYCGAIFLTYDTIKYYQYYEHLKKVGISESVLVDDVHKLAIGNYTKSDDPFPIYDYEAEVRFKEESRLIAISGGDYDDFKKGESMKVIYDPAIDDMVSANYSLSISSLIFPLVVWAIILYFSYKEVPKWFGRKEKKG